MDFYEAALGVNRYNPDNQWAPGLLGESVEMLADSGEDVSEALDVLDDAIKAGKRPIKLTITKATILARINKGDQAHKSLDNVYTEQQKKLKKLQNAGSEKEISQAKKVLVDILIGRAAIYRIQRDDYHYHQTALEIEKTDPNHKRVPEMVVSGLATLAYESIANGDLQQALAYTLEEEKLNKKYKRETDWRIPRYTFAEVIQKRIDLGEIEPLYTHKIHATFFNHLKVSYDWKGSVKSIDRRMKDYEKQTAYSRQKVLTMLIESMSNGALSLEWYNTEVNTPITNVEVNDESVKPRWRAQKEYQDMVLNQIDTFDTFFRIWNGPTGEAVGGARSLEYGKIRGTVRIHPEHSQGIWIHEFFHVVEAKVGIRPTHGYYADARKKFPQWKGPTKNQLHYFRWHFETTVNEYGYQNFRFTK
jgi:hypothetical protein